MSGDLTDRQAAKALGVHRLTIEARLLALGWLVDIGRGVARTTTAGVTGGYLSPQLAQRDTWRGPIVIEIGYRITAAGMAYLRRQRLR